MNSLDGELDKVSYKTASEGGRNYGLYKRLGEQTDNQLLRSIRSYKASVVEHQRKIDSPADYLENWESRSEAYKAGIVKKWEKDIQRNKEQLEVAVGVSDERGLYHE